jgi:TonB family protein
MGQKQVPARLGLLELQKPRASALGASFIFQCVGVFLIVVVPMLFPQKLIPNLRYSVIELTNPRTEAPLPPAPPKVHVKPPAPAEIPVEPPKVAKLMAPVPTPVAPKPKPKNISTPETPKLTPVFEAPKIDSAMAQPARPREEVKTGLLSTGSAAPATVNKPLAQVQTGGFGDPDGIAGKGDPNKRANIPQKGSFDLPGGPGYGNGTGGAKGVRGTVASTGFGNGTANPPPGNGGGTKGNVKTGGFADESTAASEGPKQRKAESTSPTQTVEIVSKPDPTYTQEARSLKLEGEVLLNVVFLASGQVKVLGVNRGLGHGLDESAVRAAEQIRFKPARRDGQPVDFPATVHIVFQLAY